MKLILVFVTFAFFQPGFSTLTTSYTYRVCLKLFTCIKKQEKENTIKYFVSTERLPYFVNIGDIKLSTFLFNEEPEFLLSNEKAQGECLKSYKVQTKTENIKVENVQMKFDVHIVSYLKKEEMDSIKIVSVDILNHEKDSFFKFASVLNSNIGFSHKEGKDAYVLITFKSKLPICQLDIKINERKNEASNWLKEAKLEVNISCSSILNEKERNCITLPVKVHNYDVEQLNDVIELNK